MSIKAEDLFDAIPGSYLVLDPDYKITAVSNGYLRATNTQRKDIVGRGLFEVFPDDPHEPNADGVRNLRASLQRVAKTLQSDTMAVQRYPIRLPQAEGGGFEERYWSPSNHPLFGPGGELAGLLHHVQDVTRLIRAGQASDALGPGHDIYGIFDHLFEGVQILDFESRYLYLNDVALRHGRSTRQQLLGKRMADCYPGIDQTELFSLLQRCLSQRGQFRLTNPFTYPDGRQGMFELLISPLPAGALILSFDVSTQVELEQRLREAERLEAIGRLAGGVAHDFNNLLTVMVGYADMMRGGLPVDVAQQEALAQILAAGSRASELTRQLLAFSRGQVLRPKVLDLNAIVTEVAGMLVRLIGSNISLKIEPSRQPQMLLADPGQMQQVVMNLALNARDAMPEGGSLVIRTATAAFALGDPGLDPAAKAGAYVRLTVADTGQGMDAETRGKIFEPFFSTKGPVKGTGLGLATVHGIVTQNGGWIGVESAPGQGATFDVYLPASTAVLEDSVEEPLPGQGPGPRTILLVEDETAVRKLFERVLAQAGYTVFSAPDARQGLELYRQHQGNVDLVVTDLSLPDKSGRILADEIRAISPDIRVLFTSGYVGPGSLSDSSLKPGESYIGKPVAPSKLLVQIREILAQV